MLGDIALDDLRFQELVSEARTRIVRHSPEWTEHNVSDPGITLIELFAWITDILVYRINRIPDRLHLALLELVGITPSPPRAARTRLRFVVEPLAAPASIPAGTEVAAPATPGQDAVVFRTAETLTLPAGRLAAHAADPVAPDEALLVGFEQPLSDAVIRLEMDGTAAGEFASDASVAWEASGPGGAWLAASVVADETDGLRLGTGAVTLALPAEAARATVGERDLHWVRCRAPWRPEIRSLKALMVGASVEAVHAATVFEESLGVSEGIAGVAYPLRHRPVLSLEPGETLEVREPGSEEWVGWGAVTSFAHSASADHHFMLDLQRGEVRFGPAIRQPDGGWRQFGAIPPAGSALRFGCYRYGGGRAGNVAADALTRLSSPLPRVASVTNPRAAHGGADAESLESARRRAALELRTRSRAVTAADLERLTLAACPQVARALCVADSQTGPVRVHVIPRVDAADRLLTRAELTPDEGLMKQLAERLEANRLIGTSILLVPARLRGVSVAAEVRGAPLADLERLRQDVEHALYTFLNPLIGGSSRGPGTGWPAGRSLNVGELFGIVYGIDSVQSVNLLRAYETDLASGEQAAQPAESHLPIRPDELIASARHFVRVLPA